WLALGDGAACTRAARAGRLRDRDSQRRYSVDFSVSRGTVRTAIKNLECGIFQIHDPPVSKVNIHGLSGWPSVPRMPSSSSIFSVRNRSSGLVNLISSTRLKPAY